MIFMSLMFKHQLIITFNNFRIRGILELWREFESEPDDYDHHLRVRRHVHHRDHRGCDCDQPQSVQLLLKSS